MMLGFALLAYVMIKLKYPLFLDILALVLGKLSKFPAASTNEFRRQSDHPSCTTISALFMVPLCGVLDASASLVWKRWRAPGRSQGRSGSE